LNASDGIGHAPTVGVGDHQDFDVRLAVPVRLRAVATMATAVKRVLESAVSPARDAGVRPLMAVRATPAGR
jgi:hypothetical protein